MFTRKLFILWAILSTALLVGGCVTTPSVITKRAKEEAVGFVHTNSFERDRRAILAMAGDYKVTFDFIETVPFVADYKLKDRKLSGGYEVVRVIEDRDDFISLQHILVVGSEEKFPIKHWRQDWRYEPEEVLVFIGGNAWEMRSVPPEERSEKWSQTVYQVDDSPRYGAVGAWSHANHISEWTPPAEWRPLPRRDMTTRDDYHAVDAVNRHVITPFGWVHEQNNTKLVLQEEPRALVREIGVNTYRHDDDFDVAIAENYWAATKDYWAEVRKAWTQLEESNRAFALTLKGEPEDLYKPLLELADKIQEGVITQDDAAIEARSIIAKYTTVDIEGLHDRLRVLKEKQR